MEEEEGGGETRKKGAKWQSSPGCCSAAHTMTPMMLNFVSSSRFLHKSDAVRKDTKDVIYG